MGMNMSRRTVLKSCAAAAGLGITKRTTAHAERKRFKRSSPSSAEMIEVGVITCGYYSHIEDIWGRLINPIGADDRGIHWPRQTGMIITKVWDPDADAARTFAEKYDVDVVDNFADMVGRIDGVIFSDFYATGWWPQLSKPYLEAGVPCLINRPFALSLDEAGEMIERSKRYNAPILAPSSDEYMYETLQARMRLRRLLDAGAQVTGVMAFEPSNEYPAHGIHSIYNIYSILEPDVIAAGLIADKWWEWGAEGGLMNLRMKGAGDAPDYYGSIRMASERDTNGWIMISTTQGRVYAPNDHVGEVVTRYRNMFLPTLLEFERMIETRTMPQSYEHIMAKTRTFLTGFYSHMERDGALVPCADVPSSWRAPQVMPGRIPDAIFNG